MTGLVTTYQFRLPRGPHEAVLERTAEHLGRAERHLHRALERAHADARAEVEGMGGAEALALRVEEERAAREAAREAGLPVPPGPRADPLTRRRNEIKVRFLREFGLTGRQYNSLLRGLEGRHDSLRELLKADRERTGEKITELEKKLKARAGKLADAEAAEVAVAERALSGKGPTKAQRKRLMSREERRSELFAQHHQTRRVEALRRRLARVETDLARDVPRVVFGSKRLLRERAALHPNDTDGIAAWRRRWETARAAGFLAMGSKTEANGCQTCAGTVEEDGRLSLRLRLPNALVEGGARHLELPPVALPKFGGDVIREALRAHVRTRKKKGEAGSPEGDAPGQEAPERGPVSYRFVRDRDWPRHKALSAWRVCITITQPVPEVTRPGIETRTRRTRAGEVATTAAVGRGPLFCGAIGVDVNVDHIAWAVIDRNGNPVTDPRRGGYGRIPLPLRGRCSGERATIIGTAARALAEIARSRGLPLVLERLDFKARKRELADKGPALSRTLSAFAYAQIQTGIRRNAARAGVELVDVNPAFTSLIGRVNYAERYGVSTHIAAAVAIARRAARFSERVNYIHGFRGRRNTPEARTEPRGHVWRRWSRVRKALRSDTGPGSRPAAGSADSLPPRAQAYALTRDAEETASLEEDRLALERLISGEIGMRPGGTPPKRTAVVRGGT